VQLIANLKARRGRRDGSEDGFTLIELMVVVLIIAILIAIAIPTFLGARERAQDRAAQSSLRNGLTAGKTIFTDNEDYTDADAAALTLVEPSLTFGAASTGPTELIVDNVSATVLVLGSLSKSGDCFWIRDDVQGSGTTYARVTGACGATPAAAGFTGW
jgi:type IV pilus assembly protein PilA